MHSRAGGESPHLSDKPIHWSARCCSAKPSDLTPTKVNAIKVKKSFFLLPNPRKSAKDHKTFYCCCNQSQTHTDTKPHTIARLLPKTQTDQMRKSFHSWKYTSPKCLPCWYMFTLLIHIERKYQNRKRKTYSMMALSDDKLTEVFKTLLWSKDKLEASLACHYEFLLLDFWSSPSKNHCSSGCCSCSAVGNIHTQEIKFCFMSLGCLFGFFSLQCYKFFLSMFWLVQDM